MNICITADDYGLMSSVNSAIEILAEEEKISAVSVMCHKDAILDTVHKLKNLNVAVGPHLVFVEEKPLLQKDKLKHLVDDKLQLPRNYWALFRKTILSPSLVEKIALEARCQIERYLSLGLKIHFVNSHQHVHLFPQIWRVIAPILKEYGCPTVRMCKKICFSLSRNDLLFLSSYASQKVSTASFDKCLSPIDILGSGKLSIHRVTKNIKDIIKAYPFQEGIMPELVCHPGLDQQKLDVAYGHWKYKWREEYELLRSLEMRNLLQKYSLTIKVPV
jgi:chitin disaccharide deacetylase